MVNPDLERILTAKTSRAALILCRDCHQWVGEGIDDTRLVTDFDLEPVADEEAEWEAGECTLSLGRDGSLTRRTRQWANGYRSGIIVREHSCEEGT